MFSDPSDTGVRFQTPTTRVCVFRPQRHGYAFSDPSDTGVTLEEFRARVQSDMASYFTQSSEQELDKIQDIIVDAYVNTPNITDPKMLRSVLISVS